MKLSFDRLAMIDAIRGRHPLTREGCEAMRRRGLMTYVGGFHDSYSWNSYGLKNLSDKELAEIYLSLRKGM